MTSPPRNVYYRSRHTSICTSNLPPVIGAELAAAAAAGKHRTRKNSLIDSLKMIVSRTSRSTSVSSGYGSNGSADLEAQSSNDHVHFLAQMEMDESNEESLLDEVLAGDEQCEALHKCGARDQMIIRNNSGPLSFSFLGGFDCHENVYAQYLKANSCYDAILAHGLVVAVDKNVTIPRAFSILMETDSGEPRATIWDGGLERHIGTLTLTDLLYLFVFGGVEAAWPTQTLSWLLQQKEKLTGKLQPESIVTCAATSSLMHVVELLTEHHIHRMPVFEGGNTHEQLLGWIGWKRVLRTVQKQMKVTSSPEFMLEPLWKVRVGTWLDLHTVNATTTIDVALKIMLDYNLSALPVLTDGNMPNVLTNVVTKSDIAGAVMSAAYELSPKWYILPPEEQAQFCAELVQRPLAHVFENRNPRSAQAQICDWDANLIAVIDQLIACNQSILFVRNPSTGECVAALGIHEVVTEVVTRQPEACQFSGGIGHQHQQEQIHQRGPRSATAAMCQARRNSALIRQASAQY